MRDIIYIFFYTAACAVLIPTPVEAPMFLFPQLSRITVLLASALGKGFGSYLIFITGDRFRKTKVFSSVIEFRLIKPVWEKLSNWSEKIIRKYGFLGFIICQGTPGLPMRSSIYSVSILGIDSFQFALGSAIGTVIRCTIVYAWYVGLKSLLA